MTVNVNGQVVLTMQKEGGVYTIPCKVNGKPLKFIFDTGASDVLLSLSEAVELFNKGLITKDDFFGIAYYKDASGRISEGLKVNITTTANNINVKHYKALLNPAIKQINFSLNSYNANSHKKSFEEYLNPILDFVKFAQENKHEYFINFRIWNLDEEKTAFEFNKKVFDKINIFSFLNYFKILSFNH